MIIKKYDCALFGSFIKQTPQIITGHKKPKKAYEKVFISHGLGSGYIIRLSITACD